MHKKCIICGSTATFLIKDTNDFYCEDCAQEQFSDVSYLIKVEEQAKELKKIVDEKIAEEQRNTYIDSSDDETL